jgi:hypothetical protein
VFGNPTQRGLIEAAIDQIWAQAGIDIAFLPTTLRYNNTFAYQGNGGTRPTSDLGSIISGATAAGVVNFDPSVLNTFFVNVVPGFGFTSEWTANGIANIGNDGIAQFVGDNLLTWADGRDVIASVVSHEIGHNLGLKHAASGLPNLMSPNGTSEQLSSTQIAAIFQTTFRNDSIALIPHGGTGFLQPFSVPLAGDFNTDGVVNAADVSLLAAAARTGGAPSLYDLNHDNMVDFRANATGTVSDSDVLIRNILMTEYGDANLDRRVNAFDISALASHLGTTGGWDLGDFNGDSFINAFDISILGSKLGFSSPSPAAMSQTKFVPEPATGVVFGIGFAAMCFCLPPQRAGGRTRPSVATQNCRITRGIT